MRIHSVAGSRASLHVITLSVRLDQCNHRFCLWCGAHVHADINAPRTFSVGVCFLQVFFFFFFWKKGAALHFACVSGEL